MKGVFSSGLQAVFFSCEGVAKLLSLTIKVCLGKGYVQTLRVRQAIFTDTTYWRKEEMKEGIHPEYNAMKITCACGNVIETKSTKKSISVEICSGCHPFFTGEQRFMDTAGKIEKFNTKYGRKPKGA